MNEKQLIEIPTHLGSEFIYPEDIISIQSKDKSICLRIENKEEIIVKLSIGKVEKLLSQAYFVRCHRCYIVNVLKIKERFKKDSSIKLVNDDCISVSDTYKKQFELALEEFCIKLEG